MKDLAESEQPSFLVFGLGAIGTYVGGSLALAGNRVIFIERPDIAAYVEAHGIQMEFGGTKHLLKQVEVVTTIPEALARSYPIAAILAVKSYDTHVVSQSILPWAGSFPPLICLQNGVENEIALQSVLPASKVISGTVTTAVSRETAGVVKVEKLRGIGLSSAHPIITDLLEIFNQASLNAKRYNHAQGMKWSKLLTNLLANASSAILDMKPEQIYAHPDLFRVESRMLKEALAVMRNLEYPVIDLPSTPVRTLVWVVRNLPLPLARVLLYQALGKGRGSKMPSFHIDLYAGRGKSEVDALNGAVVRFGILSGVSTPVNSWMMRVLNLLTVAKLPKETLAHKPALYLEWLSQNLPKMDDQNAVQN